MPSDEELLEHLRRPRERFRSALALTVEQVRGLLDEADTSLEGTNDEDLRDLGHFATGRIDPTRFSSLFVRRNPMSSASTDRVRQAYDVLTALSTRVDELCEVRVEPTGNLRNAIAKALAEVGRGFVASRLVARLKSASLTKDNERSLSGPFAFTHWSRAERALAPPLIVMQTGEAADLERLAVYEGPGIAALLPEGAARFVHDPDAGPALSERLSVQFMPESEPGHRLGRRSTRQQAQELRQLAALAGGLTEFAGGEAGVDKDPVDTLAAWLLSRADLRDL
jgi:hypothetical protein